MLPCYYIAMLILTQNILKVVLNQLPIHTQKVYQYTKCARVQRGTKVQSILKYSQVACILCTSLLYLWLLH